MVAIERELRREPAPAIEDRAALSTREACVYLNIGLTTLYRELQSGRLPFRKIGRKTVIRKMDAEQWLAELPADLGPPVSNLSQPTKLKQQFAPSHPIGSRW
ncbi:helix-turn-helix domain-containing protein [Phyllobacterium sp. UNC302MFCol5.2]|uniref:helix-turn-helix domain-containing protein n=1 Tax=Phyllobacterium sp. UNC302MFCol5.2 TaxID=1449065 RepID=UPI00056AAB26|nr:helix-turn-helix domain-containing protein [Phyllobacterium sp. UNC302MFCol5.2]